MTGCVSALVSYHPAGCQECLPGLKVFRPVSRSPIAPRARARLSLAWFWSMDGKFANVPIAIGRFRMICAGSAPKRLRIWAMRSGLRRGAAVAAVPAADARLVRASEASASIERTELAQRFVNHNRNGIGQIEAAHAGFENGDPKGGAQPR